MFQRFFFPSFPLLFFFFMTSPLNAEEAIFQNTGTAFSDLSRVIETLFPKIEGRIKDREKEQVVVSFSEKNHLVPGVLMSVVRTESPFYHPLTGDVLGYTEKKLGLVQVIDIHGNSVIGEIVEEEEPLQGGDRVRLTAGRLPLGILNLSDWDEGLFGDKLARALEDTGRFSVIEFDGRDDFGAGDGAKPGDWLVRTIKELGQDHPIPYVIVFDSSLVDLEVLIDLKVYVVPSLFDMANHSMKVPLSQEDFYILSEQPHVRPLLQRNVPGGG